MATPKLRAIFGVLCVLFLLTAGSAQAAPEPSAGSAGFFATLVEWLYAQVANSSAGEPTDDSELHGNWIPGGIASDAPDAASAEEPTDHSEIYGQWSPGG